MTKMMIMVLAVGLLLGGCAAIREPGAVALQREIAFLEQHTELILLSDAEGNLRVAVAPAYQGGVMVAAIGKPPAMSYGRIDRKHIAAGPEAEPGAFGGGDRWLSLPPEAVLTPVAQDRRHVRFEGAFEIRGEAGVALPVRVEREIRLLDKQSIAFALGMPLPAGVAAVGYQSRNVLINAGQTPWRQDEVRPDIRIGGHYAVGRACTLLLPYALALPAAALPEVSRNGRLDEAGIRVADGVVYCRSGALLQGQIGLAPSLALPWLGSYDASRGVLTVIQYNKPPGVGHPKDRRAVPDYLTEAVVAHRGGAGKRAYVLETRSPAPPLGVGGQLSHIHRTLHLQGSKEALAPLCRQLLDVDIETIQDVFGQPAAEPIVP